MVGADLLRYKKEQKFVCWDKETCHLNLCVDNYPWQVAWIIATQDKIYERHNYFINWGNKLKVSEGAARATGFDQRVVNKYGKDPKEVYLKYRETIGNKNYLLVGHNLLNFDVYIEKLWCKELGLKHSWDYLDRLIDTNAIAKAIHKNIKIDRENFLPWQYKLLGHVEKGLKTNIGFLTKKYNLEVDETRLHKADYDVEKNFEIWKKQMWEIEI